MNYKKYYSLFILLFCLTFFLTGCNPSEKNTEHADKTNPKFDDFVQQIFIDEVKTDSISLNYTLSKPERYGIKNVKPTLGDFSLEHMKSELAVTENYLTTLKSFDYQALTKEQQVTYDILVQYLEKDLESGDYFLYSEILGPTTGIQAQLPVLLAEFNYYNKQDIDTYLALLKDMPRYFEQIIQFEQEKSKAGLFMSDQTADAIISQCKEFIKDEDKNFLIDTFHDRMTEVGILSKKEQTQYEEKNKAYITKYVIPAYKTLIHGLTSLKGTGQNDGGLAGFPEGKDYYSYLVAITTGTSRSINEINKTLDYAVSDSLKRMIDTADGNISIFDKADNVKFPLTDPSEIIDSLKIAIQRDYPTLDDVDCNIKYVHKSLEDNLSPAFYLTPPLDDYSRNSIYINGSPKYNLDDIFTTLAHEGYPGHLFQTVYFNQQSPQPIRTLLSFGGYSEGWATYAEMNSYYMAGLDKKLAKIIQNNQVASLCMYAKIDLGVNYLNWDMADTADYLKEFGINDTKSVEAVYNAMVDEPANYMQYALGYLEIMTLRDKASKELGDNFNLKDFHTFFLSMGPAQFDIINKYMERWISTAVNP